jgi:hypothetical protein
MLKRDVNSFNKMFLNFNFACIIRLWHNVFQISYLFPQYVLYLVCLFNEPSPFIFTVTDKITD